MKSWRIFITPTADRAIRKLPSEVREFVELQFPVLARNNPFIGELLFGPLDWLRSFHFSVKGKPYRIAYSINFKNRQIHIHYADYRGGFYERLRKILNL